MSLEILSNCSFDLTKLKRMFLGSSIVGGNIISYPLTYIIKKDTENSIIYLNDWVGDIVTIGSQEIVLYEINNWGNNLTFTEDLVKDNTGINYIKNLSFELSNIDYETLTQIRTLTLKNNDSYLNPPTIALLIDENDQNLIVGYDNPLYMITNEIIVGGGDDLINVTFNSISKSRSRAFDFLSPICVIDGHVKQFILPTPTPTPMTPTPTQTPTQTPTTTPTLTPTMTSTPTPTPTPTTSPQPAYLQVTEFLIDSSYPGVTTLVKLSVNGTQYLYDSGVDYWSSTSGLSDISGLIGNTSVTFERKIQATSILNTDYYRIYVRRNGTQIWTTTVSGIRWIHI